MVKRYLGCIMCGIERNSATKEKCLEEMAQYGVPMIPGFEEQTHLWGEMVMTDEKFYGQGLTDAIPAED